MDMVNILYYLYEYVWRLPVTRNHQQWLWLIQHCVLLYPSRAWLFSELIQGHKGHPLLMVFSSAGTVHPENLNRVEWWCVMDHPHVFRTATGPQRSSPADGIQFRRHGASGKFELCGVMMCMGHPHHDTRAAKRNEHVPAKSSRQNAAATEPGRPTTIVQTNSTPVWVFAKIKT